MNRINKFKLKIASLLHHTFPGKYCWADCVSWAFGNNWNPFTIESSKGCETESKVHDTKMCYCGGWQDGKCWDKLPKEERERIREENSKIVYTEPF